MPFTLLATSDARRCIFTPRHTSPERAPSRYHRLKPAKWPTPEIKANRQWHTIPGLPYGRWSNVDRCCGCECVSFAVKSGEERVSLCDCVDFMDSPILCPKSTTHFSL